MMKLLARVALPVAAGVFLLAGCTSTEAGTASPANPESSSLPSTSSTSETSPSADSGSTTTASLQPCTLLAAADVSGYGSFNDGQEETLGGARVCSYQKKLASASDQGLVVGVAIRDDGTLDSTNDVGGGVKDLQINGRKAKEAPGGAATVGCTVALGVGDRSRVDVNVTAVDTTDKACQVAEEVATKFVEPKLPKG